MAPTSNTTGGFQAREVETNWNNVTSFQPNVSDRKITQPQNATVRTKFIEPTLYTLSQAAVGLHGYRSVSVVTLNASTIEKLPQLRARRFMFTARQLLNVRLI